MNKKCVYGESCCEYKEIDNICSFTGFCSKQRNIIQVDKMKCEECELFDKKFEIESLKNDIDIREKNEKQ